MDDAAAGSPMNNSLEPGGGDGNREVTFGRAALEEGHVDEGFIKINLVNWVLSSVLGCLGPGLLIKVSCVGVAGVLVRNKGTIVLDFTRELWAFTVFTASGPFVGRIEAGLMLWPTVAATLAGEVMLEVVVRSGVAKVTGDFETKGLWPGEVPMGTVTDMVGEEGAVDTGGEPLDTRKALN